MNKKEASDFLGISERTLQNLLAKGKIGYRREPDKTGEKVVFDRGELERSALKRSKAEAKHYSAVQRMEESDGLQRGAEAGDAGLQMLATLPNANQWETLGKLFEAMANQQPQQEKPDITLLAAKMLLTIGEAQTLTGLSRQVLRAAIESGDLKAALIGRGDLKSW